MSEWKNVPLHTVVNIRISNVDKKNAPNEDAVLLCNYMDVYSNDYIKAGLPFMEATANRSEISRFKVELGDVLITKDSETPFDIGIPSVVVEDIKNLVCGYHLALFKPDKSTIDSVYLAKQLATSDAASYFSRMASGSTRYGLSNKTIADFNVPLAPLREQQKIAHILTTVDNLIEKTQALIDKYTAVKQGMMHDLFTRGIDLATGQLRPSYEQAPELYKETELGWVPREWGAVPMKAVMRESHQGINTVTENIEYLLDGFPIIQAKHITGGFLDLEDVRFVGQKDFDFYKVKYRPEIDDILLSNIGTIGKSILISEEVDFLIAWNVFIIKINKEVSVGYVFLYLRYLDMAGFFDGLTTGNATKFINKSEIESIKISLPSLNEQILIREKSLSIDKVEKKNKDLLAYYQNLKKGLMQDLLTGRVRVS